MKRKWISLLLMVCLMVTGGSSVFADNNSTPQTDSLKAKVDAAAKGENGTSTLENKADKAGARAVKTLRNVGITAAVIFLTWIGFTLWGAGGNAQALASAKGRVIFFFIGLFCAFGAEWIVGTALGFILE